MSTVSYINHAEEIEMARAELTAGAMKSASSANWRPNPMWLTHYQTEQTMQNRRKVRRVIAMVFIGLAIAATTIAVGNASTKAIAELALHNATQVDQ